MVAMEGRAAWMAAWDASWMEADRKASNALKQLASRSECRAAWSAVILEARETTLSQQNDESIRIAWAAAWDAAITASRISLEKRYQKKTVYYPPAKLAPAWNATWKEAIEAVVTLLDKSEARSNAYWNAAIKAAQSVLERNIVKGLPPSDTGQELGNAAWAVVSCAVGNAEWNAAWDRAQEAAKAELKGKDYVFRAAWDHSWAEVTASVAAIVEKNCKEDSKLSHAGRIAWDAAWLAAGEAAWATDDGSPARERAAWNAAVISAKTELEKSRVEWDLSSPQKWDRDGRARREKEGKMAGATAWNVAYRAEVEILTTP